MSSTRSEGEGSPRHSFEKRASTWNNVIIPVVRDYDSAVHWPFATTANKFDDQLLLNACDETKKLLKKRLRHLEKELLQPRAARREDYICDRLWLLSKHVVDDLTHENDTIALLLMRHNMLLNARLQHLANMRSTMPSPRSMKRHPQISPRSETAHALTMVKFELLIINEDIAILERRVALCVERQHRIVNLIMHARRLFIMQFRRKEAVRLDEYNQINKRLDFLRTTVKHFILEMGEQCAIELCTSTSSSLFH